MAMLSPGTALTSAGAILSPDTAWTQTDGQVLAMLLTADQDGLTSWVMGLVMSGQLTMQQALALQEQLTGMAGTSLTGQFQDMVDQGLMTQDQADGLTAQLTAALTAAAGGVDGEAIRCPRPGTFEVLFQPEHPRALFRRRGGDRLRRAQLSSSAAQLSDGWRQYNEGKAEVDQARAEFEDGGEAVPGAEQTLFESRVQLEDGWQQLADGRKELDDGWKEAAEGQKELSDGWAELEDARQEILDGEGRALRRPGRAGRRLAAVL